MINYEVFINTPKLYIFFIDPSKGMIPGNFKIVQLLPAITE